MQGFKNILCVIERTGADQPALERAVTLSENNQAALTVVAVVPRVPSHVRLPDGGPTSRELQSLLVAEYEDRIHALVSSLPQGLEVRQKILTGAPFLELIREVLRNAHDLLIKDTGSHAWLNRLLAGDDMHLLRKCPCPVWLIKPGAPRAFKRILAAVDVDDFYPQEEMETRHLLNVQILQRAASLALSEFAELHIVHAWDSVTELAEALPYSSFPSERVGYSVEEERRKHERLLEELVRTVKAENSATRDALDYLTPVTHIVKGSPRKHIPALAKRLEIDCVVLGTVARTGVRGFVMGNTAETILGQIDCSVLAVKPRGFLTPVTIDD